MTSYLLNASHEMPVLLPNVKNIAKTINIYANVCFLHFNVINLISELRYFWLIHCELMLYT
jgi:hypothetical protein